MPRTFRRGISLRHVIPNAITVMALCFGLTAIRYAISADWERAILAIMIAAVLDAADGLVARVLKGQSRFGAELDSLSDVIAFGVAPSFILYLWSLHALPKFGWVIALCHALACALRLARFNANIDSPVTPRYMAGFFTGVPSPAGAALALLPLLIWMVTGTSEAQYHYIVAPWTVLVAFLMISNIPTYSIKALRLRQTVRLGVIGLAGLLAAALMTDPWATLLGLILLYILVLPLGVYRHAVLKRQSLRSAEQSQQQQQ